MDDFDLNKALKAISDRVTDEDRAEIEADRQTKLATIAASADQDRVARAAEHEKSALEQIVMLSTFPEGELKNIRLTQTLNRLAEVLAEQGRYTEAIEVCPDDARRLEYRAIKNAIERPDDEVCDCPDEQIVTRSGTIVSPAVMNMGTVYSDKHASMMPVMQCRICGDLQVR